MTVALPSISTTKNNTKANSTKVNFYASVKVLPSSSKKLSKEKNKLSVVQVTKQIPMPQNQQSTSKFKKNNALPPRPIT